MLIGPHEIGAQSILPPFGWIEAPRIPNSELKILEIHDGLKISTNGLRHILWKYSKDEVPPQEEVDRGTTNAERYLMPIVDRRPESVALIGLTAAVSILRENSPTHLTVMEQYAIKCLRDLTSETKADSTGRLANWAPEAAQFAQDFALDMVEAFGENRFEELINEMNKDLQKGYELFHSGDESIVFQPWRLPTKEQVEELRRKVDAQA
jgi:hypothetical protein